MKVSFWWVWGELGLERAKQTSRRSQANPSSPRTHQKLTFIQLVWLFDYSIEIIVLAWSESESSVAIILPFLGTRHQHTFFDICVFNPLAPSNRSSTLSTAYRKHEQEKRHAYEESFWVQRWIIQTFGKDGKGVVKIWASFYWTMEGHTCSNFQWC